VQAGQLGRQLAGKYIDARSCRSEGPGNGLGDGGGRLLHEWVFPGTEGGDFEAAVARLQGVNRQIYDEFMSTGAVVAGRGTFEPAGGWGGDHHDGVPIYILSRNPPPNWAAGWSAVHYVSSLEAAVRDAKHAAGDKNVLVHGAGIAQRALTAGLLDELELHLVPVMLGDGRRLFELLGTQQRELERIRVLEGEGGVTHLRYRVCR
jgi:dihydrofolate reductase